MCVCVCIFILNSKLNSLIVMILTEECSHKIRRIYDVRKRRCCRFETVEVFPLDTNSMDT